MADTGQFLEELWWSEKRIVGRPVSRAAGMQHGEGEMFLQVRIVSTDRGPRWW